MQPKAPLTLTVLIFVSAGISTDDDYGVAYEFHLGVPSIGDCVPSDIVNLRPKKAP